MGDFVRLVAGAVCLLLAISGSRAGESRSWQDFASKIDRFDDQQITALAIADRRLYVASGSKLSIFDVGKIQTTDVTERLPLCREDDITAILVDAEHRELWIVANQNLHAATCYAYDLHTGYQCPSSRFLDSTIAFYQSLRTGTPSASIAAFDRDAHRAVVGFFKDGVYAYSIHAEAYELLYEPTTIYHWPTSVVLEGDRSLVGTRGDGLIAIDLPSGRINRFPDRSKGPWITALAVQDKWVYIGSAGLYKARMASFFSP